MRIGLIGGGNISETHARAAASIPGVEVIAIGSPSGRHDEQGIAVAVTRYELAR